MANDWKQVDRVLEAALQRDPGRRADFLNDACSGDESLRREVESLLAAHDNAAGFIETPPAQLAAEMLGGANCDSPAGHLIGPYKILAPIGAGGMGEVYLAEDTRLDRRVALKILPRNVAADADRMRRFILEAKAASALAHQNVCTIHDVGETSDHRPFIAMEYIEGQTLAAMIGGRHLDSSEIIEICGQVADALDEAHSKGIVHRDIKPSNIMITSRGLVKVLDFGLAKVATSSEQAAEDAITQAKTASGVVMGTVQYMSPEQALGREVDNRSDIFSLGIVMYEMAAGRVPFGGPNMSATIDQIIHASPDPISQVNPRVSAELERTIFKCLEKDRESRFQSARELRAAMQSSEPGTGWKASVRRHSIFSFRPALAVFALLLIVAALFYEGRLRKPSVPTQPEIRSLAVLPLKSLPGDANDDYLGLGLADTIITKMSQMDGLTVRPITAVRKYSSQEIDPMDAAKQLKVDCVLDGTVQRMGDRLRVNLTLTSAPGDISLWSDSFNVSFTDIFAMQEDVGEKVAARLRLKVAEASNVAVGKYSANPEAYDYYLRGMFHLGRHNRTDVGVAIENLKRAVEADQGFAIAWAELAIAYSNQAFSYAPEEKDLEERGFVAVNHALSLEPHLAEAHLARGILLWTHKSHFLHEASAKELQTAIALNPNLDEAHHQLALLYIHVGLADKALEEAERAVAIDPNNMGARLRIAIALQLQREYKRALEVYDSIPSDLFPSVWGFNSARALFYLGRKREAAERIEEVLKNVPEDEGGLLTSTQALLFAAGGRNHEAENKIRKAAEIGKGFGHFHHTAYNIASAYALMNRPEQAMYWLEQTATEGMPCYPLFDHDPNLNFLEQYPRFKAFMEKQKGLFEHYKATL